MGWRRICEEGDKGTMNIQDILKATGLPVAYGRHKKKQKLPFIVYIGDGQNNTPADNTYYYSRNRYQIEYYFTKKNEENENAIEQQLLENGFLYTKSEDVYIEADDVWVIYYEV